MLRDGKIINHPVVFCFLGGFPLWFLVFGAYFQVPCSRRVVFVAGLVKTGAGDEGFFSDSEAFGGLRLLRLPAPGAWA